MLLVFFTLTVFMLVLMLVVQKGVYIGMADNPIVISKIIFTIQTIHLSERSPDQRGSDNCGYTVY